MNGPTNHIAVYLEIVDIEKYCLGWEVNASFKLFVFDKKKGPIRDHSRFSLYRLIYMHKCAIVRTQYYLPYFMIILAIYLVDADAEIKRFHDVKTEWGFNKFLPLDSFNCHCNGYLVNDCCVFGVEVFVHERSGK
jgi:hypothetical protein